MQAAADEQDGTMAAILGLDDDQVDIACQAAGNAWIANYSAPGQVVIAGSPTISIGPVLPPRNSAPNVRCESRRRCLPRRSWHPPAIGFARQSTRSSSATLSKPSTATSMPWRTPRRRLRRPSRRSALHLIRWRQTSGRSRPTASTFVELGPGTVLTGLVKRAVNTAARVSVSTPADVDGLLETLQGRRPATPLRRPSRRASRRDRTHGGLPGAGIFAPNESTSTAASSRSGNCSVRSAPPGFAVRSPVKSRACSPTTASGSPPADRMAPDNGMVLRRRDRRHAHRHPSDAWIENGPASANAGSAAPRSTWQSRPPQPPSPLRISPSTASLCCAPPRPRRRSPPPAPWSPPVWASRVARWFQRRVCRVPVRLCGRLRNDDHPAGPIAVLVIGSDAMSTIVDWTDRSTAILFGDPGRRRRARRSPQGELLGQDFGVNGDLESILCDLVTRSSWKANEVFKQAVRAVTGSVENTRAGDRRRGHRRRPSPPGQHPHHRSRDPAARHPHGEDLQRA